MNKKIFIYLVIFSLAVSFVIAPSGGGAASGGMGGSSSTTSSASSSSSSDSGGSDTYLYGLECLDTGQITFKQKPAVKSVIIGKEEGTNLTVAGDWDGTTFISEEAEITEKGTYTIHDPQNSDKTVECPGLKFSCKLVKIDIQECFYDKGKVTATFSLSGKDTSADGLQIQFQKYKSSQFFGYQKGVSTSSELKNLLLKKEKDGLYKLEVANLPLISQLKITYSGCIGKYYVSSKIDCKEKKKLSFPNEIVTGTSEKPQQEEVKEIKNQTSSSVRSEVLQQLITLLKNLFS